MLYSTHLYPRDIPHMYAVRAHIVGMREKGVSSRIFNVVVVVSGLNMLLFIHIRPWTTKEWRRYTPLRARGKRHTGGRARCSRSWCEGTPCGWYISFRSHWCAQSPAHHIASSWTFRYSDWSIVADKFGHDGRRIHAAAFTHEGVSRRGSPQPRKSREADNKLVYLRRTIFYARG